jgi:hypothetical protein
MRNDLRSKVSRGRKIMVRVLAGVSIVLCLGVVLFLITPAGAQDATDVRVSALETTVANQGDEISSLRKRVKRIEGVMLTPESGPTASTPAAASSTTGPWTFSGTGDTSLDPIEMAPGTYKISATEEGQGGFNLSVDNLTNGKGGFVLGWPPPYKGSTTFVADGGRYVFTVQSFGTWTFDIELIS